MTLKINATNQELIDRLARQCARNQISVSVAWRELSPERRACFASLDDFRAAILASMQRQGL